MQTLFTTDFLMVGGDFTGKVIRFFEVPSREIRDSHHFFFLKDQKSITGHRIQVSPIFMLSGHTLKRGFPGEASRSCCYYTTNPVVVWSNVKWSP